MRKLTLYRDDSTTQVVFENVKHFFWTAGNTVLTIAQVTDAMVEAGKDERMRCFTEPQLDVGTALTRIYKAMHAAGVEGRKP